MELMKELKEKMNACGAFLLHVGFLAKDIEAMREKLSATLPAMGAWDYIEKEYTEDVMVVGPANTLQCSQADLYGDIRVEIVRPVPGKCPNSHFEDYFAHRDEGLHHLCYGFPTWEDFFSVKEYMEKLGCKCVYHAKNVDPQTNECFCEFCYMEVIPYGLYIEVNCNIRRTAARAAAAAAAKK